MTSDRGAPLPSRDQILEFIRDSEQRVGKREIARAFNLDADQKRELKKLLRELEQDGSLQRGRSKRFAEPGTLPDVTVLEVTGIDLDGEMLARPMNWNEDEQGTAPTIYMVPERRGSPALGVGERVLARLKRIGKDYEARTIKRIAAKPSQVLGIFEPHPHGGGRVMPTDRKQKQEVAIRPGDEMGAGSGELVRVEVRAGKRLGLRNGVIVERITEKEGPKAISLIALHEQQIPIEFHEAAVRQAENSKAAPMEKREDLRRLPLVTIDGADARDFDDAVHAEPDDADDNDGGFKLIVAIADVGWYVRPDDALDRNAYERGNSVYLPDRVVPMLPEALSNGWCSLNPGEDRPVLAAHLRIDRNGQLKGQRFTRAMIRSHARLTYEQVQAAQDGRPDEATEPLMETVVEPLYAAYAALKRHREARGVLDLDLPERKVLIDRETGHVDRIVSRERYDSHRLIEEFMICANVAAATVLEQKNLPCMYRVHDQPSEEKLLAFHEFCESIGQSFPKSGAVRPERFNRVIEKARGGADEHMVSEVVLRTQAQAEYSPDNIGHFGLALRRYAHFTSPIRRYPDLLVHRALIKGFRLGAGGLEKDHKDFNEMGEYLSMTERRAAMAERNAVDRFTAYYLENEVGAQFSGKVNGVTRFGLFVTLEESGADGLIPISSLPNDYYDHVESSHALVGRRTGRTFRLGDRLDVQLAEANPVTASLVFELLEGDDGRPARGTRGRQARPARGRPGAGGDKKKTTPKGARKAAKKKASKKASKAATKKTRGRGRGRP